ncbi:tRNA 2-thiouridine(34) synthase MnmA [Alistipes indistinctus]|uniref:tRNA 2-thiouridine(34) synthase MnmA n=1 Tax=Alistipes indistinctus TaxID=626932 RepID=UPI000E4CCA89|nr:tRNA 2-thiouridine(34) synthase MnmA [Alistipes indistinctus]RGU37335.1 tRNA 2-thiouridine(34) synthase MnmA [Alistipes indistinctus]
MKRVVVGLSGGVDSSVAAYLLKEQGYDVVGLFMRNWHDTTGTLEGDCPWYDDQMFAELTAKRLDIPFHFIDLSDEYRRRVVDYMFAEYGRGRTPNPDVLCNREIKFDAFLQAALKLGADYVATGHYCRREVTETDEGPVYRLLAGSDPNKDQSYFLCQLTQEQLSRALFPIGHLLKPEVRRIAAEQHLATAQRKDSQGICFVGKVDLPVFLQQQLKAREGAIVEIPASWPGYALRGRIAAPGERSTAWELPADGPFSQEQLDALAEPYRYTPEAGRQAGTHRGAHFFTIGQRKGLGVGGYAEPLFVIASDVEHNVLYVGMGQEHPGLYRRALRILPEEMHWIRPDRALQPGGSARFSMRIRYRQPLQGGVLHVTEQGGYIVFDRPQRGVTAGQFAAWYDGDELVGSGVIHR